jgi:hypothetical protein
MCVSRSGMMIIMLSAVLLGAAAALMAASTGLKGSASQFFYAKNKLGSSGTGLVNEADIGAFQQCNIVTTYLLNTEQSKSSACYDIDKDCYKRDSDGNKSSMPLPRCDQFNAFRGLLIIATIAAGVGLFVLVVAGVFCPIAISLRYIAFILAVLAGLIGMVSMALLIDYKKQLQSDLSSDTTVDFGTSFILQVIGWPLALFAAYFISILLRWFCGDCIA